MRKDFRIQIENIHKAALESVGVKGVKKITAHRDASATVASSEKVAAAVARIPDVEVLLNGSTSITFRVPAAVQYAEARPALTTPQERAEAKAEREARKAAKRAQDAPEVEDDLDGLDEEFGEDGTEGI
jgi:hypothetical protein